MSASAPKPLLGCKHPRRLFNPAGCHHNGTGPYCIPCWALNLLAAVVLARMHLDKTP